MKSVPNNATDAKTFSLKISIVKNLLMNACWYFA